MATIETDLLFSIHALQGEIWRSLERGNLDAEDVFAAMQSILDGIYPLRPTVALPGWYVSPEQQLERARQLWPGVVLPEPPVNFVPQTQTEVLLLHVPRSFNELWDTVVAPEYYEKHRQGDVLGDEKHLRLAPNILNRTEAVWLGFDPEHGKGEQPESFWGQPNLAASEVLSALIQFPGWSLAWFSGASAPRIAGYQLYHNHAWSFVPTLDREIEPWANLRQLRLDASWIKYADLNWSSPVVRELLD